MVDYSTTSMDDGDELIVLVPVAPAKLAQVELCPRSRVLSGKRFGLFWNRKPNGDVLLSSFQELLKERYNNLTINWLEGKTDPAQPAPASSIKEASLKCDAVILATGD